MGRLDNLKLWLKCKTSGRSNEYESYKKAVAAMQGDVNRYTKYLNDATEKFTNIQQKFSPDSKEYVEAREEMYRWTHSLNESQLNLKFIRPNSQEDIDYRNSQCETFVDKLQEVLSPNFDLRFHGTPIYFAEQIIKSGQISSTADRYDGYVKSTDMKGEISAANGKTIGRTINFFSDMNAYNRDLPAGCIFAILPKDKEDAEYGHDLMHSVDFKQNPEQFFGVFTTPENIEQVKEWMNESGFNPEKAYTFEGFLEAVKQKSMEIDNKIKVDNESKNIERDNSFSNEININGLAKNALGRDGITFSEKEQAETEQHIEQPTKEGASLDEK